MAPGELPVWFRPMNRAIVLVQRAGLPVGPVHLLTVAGRTSGRPRTTPVTPITVDGTRFLVAALPDADWARNARAVGRGELARGRRRHPVYLVEVQDLELRRTVLRTFPRQAPGGVRFFVRLGLVTEGTPEQFAAIADRVAVFALDDIAPAGVEHRVDAPAAPADHGVGAGAAVRGERAAVAVGVLTTVLGVALVAHPRTTRPLLGLADRRDARVLGAVDLVVAAGLLAGRPRWPWLAVRAALNLPTAAFVLRRAAGTDRAGHARVAAALVTAATVGDVAAVRAMRSARRTG